MQGKKKKIFIILFLVVSSALVREVQCHNTPLRNVPVVINETRSRERFYPARFSNDWTVVLYDQNGVQVRYAIIRVHIPEQRQRLQRHLQRHSTLIRLFHSVLNNEDVGT